MHSADAYRKLAAELRARAEKAVIPETAVELRHLADVYLRLATDAERNARTDLVYEPRPPKLHDGT